MDVLPFFPPTLYILLYLVGAFGFFLLLVQSTITLPLRVWAVSWRAIHKAWFLNTDTLSRVETKYTPLAKLVQLVECPLCLGFWTGVFTTFYWFGLARCTSFPLLPIIIGCVTSATNTVLFHLVDTKES